jgi:hypothetical protein
VLVNENYEIIDGQHCFQACQDLEIPVYYILFPGLTIATAQTLNALQRPWKIFDYAQSYAAAGNPHYKLFMDTLDGYQLPAGSLLDYMSNRDRRQTHQLFIEGKFTVRVDREQMKAELDKLASFERFAPFWNQSSFASAFRKVLKIPGYNHDRMVRGLEGLTFRRQGSQAEYLRELERIYNSKTGTAPTRFV